MYDIKLKLDTSFISEISSKANRRNLTNKLREYFSDYTLYTIYESHHNFIVEHNYFDYYNELNYVLRIVFDDDNNIVSIFAFDVDVLKLKSLIIDSEEIEINSLVDWIVSHEDYKVHSACPYKKYKLTKDVLNPESKIKLCSDESSIFNEETSSCFNCDNRSRRYVSIQLIDKDLCISYNADKENCLSIMPVDLSNDGVDKQYGFRKSLDGNFIEDNCEMCNYTFNYEDDSECFDEISELDMY